MDPTAITQRLLEAREGGKEARDRLLESVYGSLKQLAVSQLRGRDRAPTLDATDLVHEAYLRLVDQTQVDWRDRQHFFAVAARAMRQITIDHARRRRSHKRGGSAVVVTLDEARVGSGSSPDELLAIDEALTRIESTSPRLVEMIELCFFAGMTIEEAAALQHVTSRTVKRDLRRAKSLLYAVLNGTESP
jgi:RNA polymerase sigma factor (TIGR02999 family)